MVNDIVSATLKRQGSRGLAFVRSQSKFIFDIQVHPYWLKWLTKHSKQATKDLKTAKFHRDPCNRYLMLGFISAHTTGNAISALEVRRKWKGCRSNLMLRSATTLSNIFWSEYAQTVDANKKQLPLWNKVSLALGRWTLPNKLAITSANAYSMDWNLSLSEVHFAFDEGEGQFISSFENYLRMPNQTPTYCTKASRAFGERAWSFWAYQPLIAKNCDR